MELAPFQLRVIQERNDLNDKIVKLDFFINGKEFSKINSAEQIRLSQQLDAMTVYVAILDDRIANFSPAEQPIGKVVCRS